MIGAPDTGVLAFPFLDDVTCAPEGDAPDVNDRRTPDAMFTRLNAAHRFTIDVAASHENAKCARYFTADDDALIQSWAGERVWCNPPFGDLAPWVIKAWREMVAGGCERVVMLLPSTRTEQEFWAELIEPFRDGRRLVRGVSLTCEFVRGRPRFGMPPNLPTPRGGWRPPFGVVLVTWWTFGAMPCD